MVTYRYLGSASTDANGIAKYNFTGSGAGEIDYIASLDNPITDGSIVSETYSILDCIYYDKGTGANTLWTSWSLAPANIGQTNDYRTVTKPSTSNAYICTPTNTLNNVCIEYDVYQDGGADNIFAQLRGAGATVLLQFKLANYNLPLDTWNHLKMRIIDNQVYWNDNPSPSVTLSNTAQQFYFSCLSTTNEVRFKNWKCYPI